MICILLSASTLLTSTGCLSSTAFRQANPDARIIAFGDSATRGPALADYSDMLPELLGVPDVSIVNEGDPGETSEEGRERLQELIEFGIFPNAEVLIYWQGGVDAIDIIEDGALEFVLMQIGLSSAFLDKLRAELDHIEAELSAGVKAAQDAGWEVYILTYFPLAPDRPCRFVPFGQLTPGIAAILNTYVELLNNRIRTVAATTGATLVDIEPLGETLLADSSYFDCNHLSAKGNAMIAEQIAEVIRNIQPRSR